MKRLFTKWPFAVMVLLLAGCGKNNQPEPVFSVEPLGGRVSRIDHDAWTYDSIFYNENNRSQVNRVKTFSKHPQGIQQTFDIEYNVNNTVKQVVQNNGEKYVYQYVSDQQRIVVSHYSAAGMKLDYMIYDYFPNGQLYSAEKVEAQDPAGRLYDYVSQRIYSYRADGNLDREEVNKWTGQQFDADFVITYDNYDQSFNVDNISNYLYLGFYSFMKNNPRKRIVTINGVSTEHNYSYQYSTSLVPVERKHTYISQGQPYEEISKYFYY